MIMRRFSLCVIVVALVALFLPLRCFASTDSIKDVRALLGNKLGIIWGYDGTTQSWKLSDPDNTSISDLIYLESGVGYWFQAKQSCTLYWGYNYFNLYKGWNLIGWIGTSSATATPTATPTTTMAYTSGGDSYTLTNQKFITVQTFKCFETTLVTQVSTWMYRTATSGDLAVSICSVNDGLPGLTLASTYCYSSSIAQNVGKVTIPLSISLPAGSYALVLRPVGTHDENHYIGIMIDKTSPTYEYGNLIISENSGASWDKYVNYDMLFQIN